MSVCIRVFNTPISTEMQRACGGLDSALRASNLGGEKGVENCAAQSDEVPTERTTWYVTSRRRLDDVIDLHKATR
jgi:hypothetical protein